MLIVKLLFSLLHQRMHFRIFNHQCCPYLIIETSSLALCLQEYQRHASSGWQKSFWEDSGENSSQGGASLPKIESLLFYVKFCTSCIMRRDEFKSCFVRFSNFYTYFLLVFKLVSAHVQNERWCTKFAIYTKIPLTKLADYTSC